MKNHLNRLSPTFLIWTLAVAAFFVLAAVSVAFFAARAPEARAAGSTALKGWAWSSTIGWISFSGTTKDGNFYGVSEAPDGTLSGHAWSNNIGWISFNSVDVADCPSSGTGTCEAKVQPNGNITGWARAIVAKSSNSWTGWISFSGPVTGGGSYGVKRSSGGTWSDFAWGGKIIGWVNFSGTTAAGTKYCVSENGSCTVPVPQPAPQITSFKATPTSISSSGSSKLSWASLNTNSCTAGGAWKGTQATSGSNTVTPSTSSTYKITCSGPGGRISKSVKVIVTVVGSGVGSPPSSPSGTLTAFPTMVKKGSSVPIILEWTVKTVKGASSLAGKSCEIKRGMGGTSMKKIHSKLRGTRMPQKASFTGNYTEFTGNYKDKDNASGNPHIFNHQTVYTLSCGSTSNNTVVLLGTARVNLVPQYSSF